MVQPSLGIDVAAKLWVPSWTRLERNKDGVVRSTRFGSRSYPVCGPTIWNKIPQDLRSTDTREQLKRSLKRWLYIRVCSRQEARLIYADARRTNGLTYLLNTTSHH